MKLSLLVLGLFVLLAVEAKPKTEEVEAVTADDDFDEFELSEFDPDENDADFWWWWRYNPNCWFCADSCEGLADGDYQSCDTCYSFITCSNGHMIAPRPCAPADPPLVWDDWSQTCEYRSRTCFSWARRCRRPRNIWRPPRVQWEAAQAADTPAEETVKAPAKVEEEEVSPDWWWWWVNPNCRRCVNDCSGLADGDYQSCFGCNVFATCSNGQLIDNRPCPAGLVWNDRRFGSNAKRCDWVSSTCSNGCPIRTR